MSWVPDGPILHPRNPEVRPSPAPWEAPPQRRPAGCQRGWDHPFMMDPSFTTGITCLGSVSAALSAVMVRGQRWRARSK